MTRLARKTRLVRPWPRSHVMAADAAILVFLFSWDELTDAVLLRSTHRTMPPLIDYYTSDGQMGAASVLAVITPIPAALIVAVRQRFVRRGALTGGVNE